MTLHNATPMRPARRPFLRAGALGLAIGLVTAFGAADAAQAARVLAAQSAATAPTPNVDPSKNVPGTIAVSNIDFKRGDGGSGRLSLRFSGAGAIPDLRNEGSRVIIDVGNAKLPASLAKPLNVADFATPVQRIDARADGAGTKLVLATNGNFESMAYQSGNEYVVEIVPRAARRQVGGNGQRRRHGEQRPGPRLQRPPGDLQLPGRAGAHRPAADRRGIQPQRRRLRHGVGQRHAAPDQRAVGPGAGHRPARQGPGQAPRRQRGVGRPAGGDRQVRTGEGRRAHRDRKPRRDDHGVHPDQLRQRRGHRQAADRGKQVQLAAVVAAVANAASAASSRRAAA